MDPITALSVAGTAVQFLQFALQVLSTCRQVRDGSEGAVKANKDLKKYSEQLASMSNDLEAAMKSGSKPGRHVATIAQECSASATELKSLVEKIRAAGNANAISVAKTTFRIMEGRREVEKLENRMKECRARLDSAVLQDMRHRTDLSAIQQQEGFASLEKSVQDLVIQLSKRDVESKQCIQRTNKALVAISAQNDDLAASSAAAHALTQKQISQLYAKEAKENLLDSLFYPEHTFREKNIGPPFERTFEWIFERDRPPDSQDHDDRSEESIADDRDESDADNRDEQGDMTGTAASSEGWPKFSDWLESDKSLYWITGKPGSGKSTLMRHIVSNPKTEKGLEKWALDKKVQTFSFFFWRAAERSPLQKSIEGLLRSLLHQVLERIDGLPELLLQERHIAHTRIATWTEQDLCEILKQTLSLATDLRFCFFIDGLDEFDGKYDKLLNTIFELQDLSHVKFCVASRPEPLLALSLSCFPHLKMENLNGKDIERFVHSKLASFGLSECFEWQITHRAEGVFLWAALATESVSQGVQLEDSPATLKQRINKLPKELSTLFYHLLSKVDSVHRKSLGRFLRAKELIPHLRVTSIAARSLGDAEINTYQDFWNRCAKVAKQIEWQSHGILIIQVTEERSLRNIGSAPKDSPNWVIPSDERLSELLPDLRSTIEARKPTSDDLAWKTMSTWHGNHVLWTHRSAYDFVFGDGKESLNNLVDMPSKETVADEMFDAMLKLWSISPLHSGVEELIRIPYGLRDVLWCLGEMDLWLSKPPSVYLTYLESLVARLDTNEIECLWRDQIYDMPKPPDTGSQQDLLPSFVFWSVCAECKALEPHLDPHLDGIAARKLGHCILVMMIAKYLSSQVRSWDESHDFEGWVSPWVTIHRMMSLLLQLLEPRAKGSARTTRHRSWHRPYNYGFVCFDWDVLECDDMDHATQEYVLRVLIDALSAVVWLTCWMQLPHTSMTPERSTGLSGIAAPLDQLFAVWGAEVRFILDDSINLRNHKLMIRLEAHFGNPIRDDSHAETFGPLKVKEPLIWLEVRYVRLAPAEAEKEENKRPVHDYEDQRTVIDGDPLVRLRLQLVGNSKFERVRVRVDHDFGMGGNAVFAVEIYDALLRECWENTSGTLDSWQQLCAVACIRMMQKRREDRNEMDSFPRGRMKPTVTMTSLFSAKYIVALPAGTKDRKYVQRPRSYRFPLAFEDGALELRPTAR